MREQTTANKSKCEEVCGKYTSFLNLCKEFKMIEINKANIKRRVILKNEILEKRELLKAFRVTIDNMRCFACGSSNTHKVLNGSYYTCDDCYCDF